MLVPLKEVTDSVQRSKKSPFRLLLLQYTRLCRILNPKYTHYSELACIILTSIIGTARSTAMCQSPLVTQEQRQLVPSETCMSSNIFAVTMLVSCI